MRHLLPLLLAAVCVAAAGPVPVLAQAGGVLRGRVKGELSLPAGLPTLPWSAEVEQHLDGRARYAASAEFAGAPFAATLQLQPAKPGWWKIERASWDLNRIWTEVVQPLVPDLSDLAVTGELRLHGEGRWHDESPEGPLQVTWGEGTVTMAEPAVSAEGVELAFELNNWMTGQRAGQGALKVARATVGTLEFTDAVVALLWQPNGAVFFGPGEVNALGGKLVLGAVEWTGPAELVVRLRAVSLSLAELARLSPSVIRRASGTVSGELVVRWDEKAGLLPIDGRLAIDREEGVEVTLAPQPGFLTDQVPRRYELLPSWLGPIARAFAPKNPAHPMLVGIELGQVPLRVEDLAIFFYPPDDPFQRTARIQLEGHPTDHSLVEKVSIQINLSGPWTDILRLGLDDRADIQARLE